MRCIVYIITMPGVSFPSLLWRAFRLVPNGTSDTLGAMPQTPHCRGLPLKATRKRRREGPRDEFAFHNIPVRSRHHRKSATTFGMTADAPLRTLLNLVSRPRECLALHRRRYQAANVRQDFFVFTAHREFAKAASLVVDAEFKVVIWARLNEIVDEIFRKLFLMAFCRAFCSLLAQQSLIL